MYRLTHWLTRTKLKLFWAKETLNKARLTALYAICLQIFRHIAQKSDDASYAQALFSVSPIIL